MDDMLDSECSSGCESGWTLYLEHSFLSPHPSKRRKTEEQSVSEDEEEEDLSMVSDASSGPRIFHEEECFGNAGNGFFCRAAGAAALLKNGENREQKRGNRHREVEEDDPSFLDDTASSPICNFSQSAFKAVTWSNIILPHNGIFVSRKNNYPLTNEEASMANALDFSQGWSATHSETNNGSTLGRSAIFHDEPFDFFQFPMSGDQLQQNQWFGRNLGMR